MFASFFSLNASNKITESQGQNQGEHSTRALRGRDILSIGKPISVKGTLTLEGIEWVLINDQERYNIHLGPVSYRDSKNFTMANGASAYVIGMVYKNDIAVFQIETNGKSVILRDKTARPAWAGTKFSSGRNRNKENIPTPTETLEDVPELN